MNLKDTISDRLMDILEGLKCERNLLHHAGLQVGHLTTPDYPAVVWQPYRGAEDLATTIHDTFTFTRSITDAYYRRVQSGRQTPILLTERVTPNHDYAVGRAIPDVPVNLCVVQIWACHGPFFLVIWNTGRDSNPRTGVKSPLLNASQLPVFLGAAARLRTPIISLTRGVLYQLSYVGNLGASRRIRTLISLLTREVS